MNCKPGDLALVVKGINRGKLVTCLRILNGGTELEHGIVRKDKAVWEIDRALSWPEGLAAAVCDEAIMPIRPPASDESDTADQDLPAECGA